MSQGQRYYVESVTFGNSMQNLVKSQKPPKLKQQKFYRKSYDFSTDLDPQLSLSTSRGDSIYPSNLPELIPKTPYELHIGVTTEDDSGVCSVEEDSKISVPNTKDVTETKVKNEQQKTDNLKNEEPRDNFVTSRLVTVASSLSCDPISIESCTQLTNHSCPGEECSMMIEVKPSTSSVKKVAPASAKKPVVKKTAVVKKVVPKQSSKENAAPKSPTTSKTAVVKKVVPKQNSKENAAPKSPTASKTAVGKSPTTSKTAVTKKVIPKQASKENTTPNSPTASKTSVNKSQTTPSKTAVTKKPLAAKNAVSKQPSTESTKSTTSTSKQPSTTIKKNVAKQPATAIKTTVVKKPSTESTASKQSIESSVSKQKSTTSTKTVASKPSSLKTSAVKKQPSAKKSVNINLSANKVTRYSQDEGRVSPKPPTPKLKKQTSLPVNEQLFRESLMKKLEKVGRKFSVTKSELQQNLNQLAETMKYQSEISSQSWESDNLEQISSTSVNTTTSTKNTDKFSSKSDQIDDLNKKTEISEFPPKADPSSIVDMWSQLNKKPISSTKMYDGVSTSYKKTKGQSFADQNKKTEKKLIKNVDF